jgi:hypothetical protein
MGDGIQVRLGAKPFTWFVNDGVSEYIVTTNLFPQEGIVLWIGSSYAEALFLP